MDPHFRSLAKVNVNSDNAITNKNKNNSVDVLSSNFVVQYEHTLKLDLGYMRQKSFNTKNLVRP